MKSNFNREWDSFSRELRLILEIIKKDGVGLQKELFTDIDWNLFLQLTSHHRLYPAVYKKIKVAEEIGIPPFVMKTLREWYERNTFRMLQLSGEMEQISKWFAENEVQSLFLKGPVLAYDLYGDLSMRTSKDLDILIPIEKLDKVNQLLLDDGYMRESSIVLNNWKWKIQRWKNHHLVYSHPQKGISLEIHWKMHPSTGREPAFKELWNRKRKSPTHHFPVYFLGREDLCVFLIKHGARHGWFRLRWLADIDRMIKLGINWGKVALLLKEYNYQNLGGQTFILASRLLGTHISEEMKSYTEAKKSSSLAENALLFIKHMENLHDEELPKDVSKDFYHYLISIKNFQEKCLYFPVQPLLWVWRRIRRHTVS